MASSVAEDIRVEDVGAEYVEVEILENEDIEVEDIQVEEIDIDSGSEDTGAEDTGSRDTESEDTGAEYVEVEDAGVEYIEGEDFGVEEIEIDPDDPLIQPYVPLFQRILWQGMPMHPQNDCLLLTKLSPETRWMIWNLVLTDDENLDARYSTKTYHSRPSYRGPRRTACVLLRTCRQIFAEAYFLPFSLKEQIHWICEQDRAPPEYVEPLDLLQLRALLIAIPAQQDVAEVKYNKLQTFAQMYRLEDGSLAALLSITGQQPRRLTLTIRHTDWWHWEEDKDLRFNAAWIDGVSRALPLSCFEFTLELESLERKKDQVDTLAKHISERWFFKRRDGIVLFPDASGKCHRVTRWTGPSTINGKRWKEHEARKRKLDYYILAIKFVPMLILEAMGGVQSPEARRDAAKEDFVHLTAKLEDSDDEDEFEEDQDELAEDEGDIADNGDDANGDDANGDDANGDNDGADDTDDVEMDEDDSSSSSSDESEFE